MWFLSKVQPLHSSSCFTHIGFFPPKPIESSYLRKYCAPSAYLKPIESSYLRKYCAPSAYRSVLLHRPHFLGLFHHNLTCICYGNVILSDKCQRLLNSLIVAILSYGREFCFKDWGKSLTQSQGDPHVGPRWKNDTSRTRNRIERAILTT
jgi:hypothetical protein